MKRLKLREHDHIVAAFAQPAAGPGWSNTPVWLVVRSALDGSHRMECLQPDQITETIHTLYGVSAATHEAMTAAARLAVVYPTSRKPLRTNGADNDKA